MNKKQLILLILFFAFTACQFSFAQGQQKIYTQLFLLDGNITLDSLTQYVHKNSSIRFSFNSAKVKGSKEINFSKGRYSIQGILKQINKTTSLYYSFYSGYVVFQDNPPRQVHKTGIKKINRKSNFSEKNRTRYPNKNLEVNLQKKDTKTKIILPKNIIRQKQVHTPDTIGNNIIRDENTNLKKVTPNKSFNDSSKTPIAIKDSIPIGVDKNISPNDINKITTPVLKNDTSIILNASPDKSLIKTQRKKNSTGSKLHYGLQWNIIIPIHGVREYFTGTKSKSQPYNLLIPGLWLSKTMGKQANELLFILKPEQQFYTGNKIVAISTGSVSSLDSSIIQKNTVVIKTNSLYAGLQYNFWLNDKWNIGGGINLHWQYAALLNLQTTRLLTGVLLADSLYGIKKSSSDWKYFNPSFITLRVELLYSLKKYQIGAAVFKPVTNIFEKQINNTYPINGHVFFCWRIK